MALTYFDYRIGKTREATDDFAASVKLIPVAARTQLIAWLRGSGLKALQSAKPTTDMMKWWAKLESTRANDALTLDNNNLTSKQQWIVATTAAFVDTPSAEAALITDLLSAFQPQLEAAQGLDFFDRNTADDVAKKDLGLASATLDDVTSSANSLADLITAIGAK
jgi:hypothetical protein